MSLSYPRISVVVPHLNQPEALRACLAALAAQRAEGVGVETIVVDNGSTVPPAALCAGFGVRLEAEATPGPGPARSRGAALATGDVLAFIDADCTAEPGWIAGIAAHFAGPDPADVIGGAVRIAPRDPDRLTVIEAFESVFSYRMRLFIARDRYTATCNMAVRRAVFEAVGPFVGIAVAEDVDWGQRASARGYRLAYVPEVRVATRARASFAELARKWDRHIAHDFAVVPPGAKGAAALDRARLDDRRLAARRDPAHRHHRPARWAMVAAASPSPGWCGCASTGRGRCSGSPPGATPPRSGRAGAAAERRARPRGVPALQHAAAVSASVML